MSGHVQVEACRHRQNGGAGKLEDVLTNITIIVGMVFLDNRFKSRQLNKVQIESRHGPETPGLPLTLTA
jgi:hypothetical protein